MNIRLLIRTHYFDETLQFLYEKWSRILPGAVGVLVDETRGPDRLRRHPESGVRPQGAQRAGPAELAA